MVEVNNNEYSQDNSRHIRNARIGIGIYLGGIAGAAVGIGVDTYGWIKTLSEWNTLQLSGEAILDLTALGAAAAAGAIIGWRAGAWYDDSVREIN